MKFVNKKNIFQIKYWIYVIAILLIIRSLFESWTIGYDGTNLYPVFKDFWVIILCSQEFVDGRNPYALYIFNTVTEIYETFPFPYSPIVLIFFKSINEFLSPFLIFAYLMSILLFCLSFRKEPKIFIYSILISIALLEIRRASFFSSLFVANVGFFLHLAIISLWLLRNNFNTKIALYVAIVIGAMFKAPIFSFYVLLPLLADARISVSRITPGLITVIVVILVYAIQSVTFPELFSSWMGNITDILSDNQVDLAVLDSNPLGKTSISGWSIFSVWLKVSHSYVIATLGYVITCLSIIAFWVYYKRRYLDKLKNTDFVRTCISIIPVVICILIMPRIEKYDYTVMNFLLLYLLLKIKVFEINYNFIFKSKISLLGITAISIWTIQWISYFLRHIQIEEAFSMEILHIFSIWINIWFPTFLVIIIALVDRSIKIRLGTWPK